MVKVHGALFLKEEEINGLCRNARNLGAALETLRTEGTQQYG